jgi:predicted transcriptional regulator
MKTTLELPDDLLTKAKAVAARRHTTLKAMMEHALRRELGDLPTQSRTAKACIMVNERGFPVLRRQGQGRLTSEMVYAMQETGDLE